MIIRLALSIMLFSASLSHAASSRCEAMLSHAIDAGAVGVEDVRAWRDGKISDRELLNSAKRTVRTKPVLDGLARVIPNAVQENAEDIDRVLKDRGVWQERISHAAKETFSTDRPFVSLFFDAHVQGESSNILPEIIDAKGVGTFAAVSRVIETANGFYHQVRMVGPLESASPQEQIWEIAGDQTVHARQIIGTVIGGVPTILSHDGHSQMHLLTFGEKTARRLEIPELETGGWNIFSRKKNQAIKLHLESLRIFEHYVVVSDEENKFTFWDLKKNTRTAFDFGGGYVEKLHEIRRDEAGRVMVLGQAAHKKPWTGETEFVVLSVFPEEKFAQKIHAKGLMAEGVLPFVDSKSRVWVAMSFKTKHFGHLTVTSPDGRVHEFSEQGRSKSMRSSAHSWQETKDGRVQLAFLWIKSNGDHGIANLDLNETGILKEHFLKDMQLYGFERVNGGQEERILIRANGHEYLVRARDLKPVGVEVAGEYANAFLVPAVIEDMTYLFDHRHRRLQLVSMEDGGFSAAVLAEDLRSRQAADMRMWRKLQDGRLILLVSGSLSGGESGFHILEPDPVRWSGHAR